MKFLRYGPRGQAQPGLVDRQGRLRDLSGVIADLGPSELAPASLERLKKLDTETLPQVAGSPRIGACVAKVPKLVCVGLNYRDHADETKNPYPKEPVLFMKAISSISGPNDDVVLPKGSQKGSWEVELGSVSGTTARYVAEKDWLSHVPGFCLFNDVSEREFQMERGGQW